MPRVTVFARPPALSAAPAASVAPDSTAAAVVSAGLLPPPHAHKLSAMDAANNAAKVFFISESSLL